MQRHLVLLASLVLFGISSTFAANWAVLVAGSNEWYNYRHQADVCHAYQILHKHNIPDSNIIVMMYDDIAQNTENPTKGVIINHPNGQDVYHGVPKDYTGDDVTPTNFLNVLLGKKDVMRGVGSGKVLESGPDDNVFIFYSDHGAVGLVAFPAGGYLYATDLNKTITQMYNEKKYKQLVIYLEACESGSMLDTLPTNMNIYATTASNPEESSYACYFDATRQTYLGDLYSVNWMEDSDAENINTETLFQQFAIVRDRTNLSHVMQYGDLTLGQSHHVSEFQAENAQVAKPQRNLFKSYYNQYLQQDAVPTVSVRMSIVSRRLAAATDEAQKQALQLELVQLLNDQATIADKVHQIASKSLGLTSGDYFDQITQKHMKFTQHDCYKSVTQHMEEKCFDLANEFALNKLYVIANLCQIGLYDFTIKNAVDAVCQERLSFKY